MDLANLDIVPIEHIPLTPPQHPLKFNREDLRKVLKQIKNKRCYGLDNLPLKVAKDYCEVFPDEALKLFNSMAKYGIPEAWKMARVLPLFKKGDKDKVVNYRPISNLNSLSKVYEKLVLEKLMRETSGMEGTSQHGFRPHHSTTTACLELQSVIAKGLDEGKVVAVYSVDLSAAFDLLRADTLLDLFRERDISDGLVFTIVDFLQNRSFLVEVEGKRSEPVDLNIGCVQGSTLGPRLFSIYCGGIAKRVESNNVHFLSYADDSYVVITGGSEDEIKRETERVSKIHVQHLKDLGMKVNETKTEAVIFNKKGHLRMKLRISDVEVSTISDMKVLGMTFNENLKWETQVKNTIAKCNSKLGVLKKLRNKFTEEQFLKIVTSQYYSTLYYGGAVWLPNISYKDGKLIESAHNKALRIAFLDRKKKIGKEDLAKKSKRAKPEEWAKYASATLVMKIIRNKSPTYLLGTLMETIFTERRKPLNGKFYNNSKGKIGKQRIQNRIGFMNGIKDEWMMVNISDNEIRQLLKKNLFTFDKEILSSTRHSFSSRNV